MLKCLRATIAIAAIWVTFGSAGASESEAGVAGRTITAKVVRKDGTAIAFPRGATTLTTRTVTLRDNGSAGDALLAQRVVPDNEAFALVYDLNPSVTDLKQLPAGSRIVVPHPLLRNAEPDLPPDALFLLTLDSAVRAELNGRVMQLGPATTAFTRGTGEQSSSAVQSVSREATTMQQWFAAIRETYLRRNGPPLRHVTLLSLDDEAGALLNIYGRTTASTIGDTDRHQVDEIYVDLGQTMKRFGQALGNQIPQAEPQWPVRVFIRGADQTRIARLRIYFTTNGMYRDPPKFPPVTSYPFTQLGSGLVKMLPVRNYRVWAANDDDPSHRLTPALFVAVEENPPKKPIPVDLLLKK